MRLVRLDLEDFAHFRNRTIELDSPPSGLRFIVGPNEAGKSTIRSAISTALFGPQGLTTSGTRSASIRLAATLVSASGPEVEIHRKGNGRPQTSTGEILDADELHSLIPIGRALFETLFSLGHDELRRNAPELLQTEGGLGRIIFGAALGGGRVHALTSELTSSIDERISSGRAKRELENALADLASIDEQIRERTVTSLEWLDRRDELDRLDEQIEQSRVESERLTAEAIRLRRITSNAPIRRDLIETRRLMRNLREEGPTIVDQGLNELLERLSNRQEHHDAIVELKVELNKLTDDRDSIDSDDRLLPHESAIRELNEKLERYRSNLSTIEGFEDDHSTYSPLPEPHLLVQALEDTADLLKHAHDIDETSAKLRARRTAHDDLRLRLGIVTDDDKEILALDVPDEELIERHRIDWAKILDRIDQLDNDFKKCSEQLGHTRAQIDSIRDSGSAASVDDLREAQSNRNAIWSSIRAIFLAENNRATSTSEREDVADQFGRSLDETDEVTERLTSNIELSAELIALESTVSADAKLQAELEVKILEAQRSLDDFEDLWIELWKAVSNSVTSPESMITWRRSWESFVTDLSQLRQDESALAVVEASLESARSRFLSALKTNAVEVDETSRFLSLHALATTNVDKHQHWSDRELEADKARSEVDRIDQSLDELRPLLSTGADMSGEDAIRALNSAREKQSSNRDRRNDLDSQIRDVEAKFASVAGEMESVEAKLASIAATFNVESEGLGQIAARSQTLTARSADESRFEADLLATGSGLTIDSLLEEAGLAGDLDEVNARLTSIDGDLAKLSQELLPLVGARTLADQELDQIDGDDAIATLAEDREQVLARVESIATDVAELILQRAVLELAVEEARTGGEGELIERAGHWFSVLTNGEFSRLDLESVNDTVHAVAVRSNGDHLYPASLSDGTLDQLWLAWRLAGIEHHLRTVGPTPVIVDDVLVHFDDERSSAAFNALAELAAETQIVVLTHHPHLTELAKNRLGDDLVSVTELEPRAASVGVTVQVVDRMQVDPELPATAPSAPVQRATTVAPLADDESALSSERVLLSAVDDEWRGKDDLLRRSGIPSGEWVKSIQSLLASGVIEQQGTKRGAKYRRTRGI